MRWKERGRKRERGRNFLCPGKSIVREREGEMERKGEEEREGDVTCFVQEGLL